MAITLQEAKMLQYGDTLHHTTKKNADGTPQRWKVNGQVKTWKRSPERVKVPVKNGLWNFDYVTETELEIVSLGEGLD
jgi:hypothetical protein